MCDRKELFRKILVELMDNNLLNDFLNIIFNYNLKNNDIVLGQYKIVNNNIILELFNNNSKIRFNVFVFSNEKSDITIKKEVHRDTMITYFYLDNCYRIYKNTNMNNLMKLVLSFKVKDIMEFNYLIKDIFPKQIEKIINNKIKEFNQ